MMTSKRRQDPAVLITSRKIGPITGQCDDHLPRAWRGTSGNQVCLDGCMDSKCANLLASCSTILNTVRRFTTFTSHVNVGVDVRLRMLRSQLLEATRILMTVFPSPQGVLHTPRSAGFKRSEAPSIKPRLQVGKGQYILQTYSFIFHGNLFLVED
jgi:hypothetical protein